MKETVVSSLVVAAVLLVGGCATSGFSPSPPDSDRDFVEMKERILELQEKAAMAEIEIERLRQRVIDLEKRLADSQAEGLATGPSRSLEPRVQETPPAVPGPGDAAAVEESDLEIEPIPATELDQDRAGAAPPAQTEKPADFQPVEPAAQALYDRGYTLHHQGRYLDAEASFQRFLQAYPWTELSDNAQFWIGESRFARGDTQGALAAFRETVQRYPQGNKVADALLKQGDCLADLGDRDGARGRYEEVKRRFPSSAAAVMAEERLAKLD